MVETRSRNRVLGSRLSKSATWFRYGVPERRGRKVQRAAFHRLDQCTVGRIARNQHGNQPGAKTSGSGVRPGILGGPARATNYKGASAIGQAGGRLTNVPVIVGTIITERLQLLAGLSGGFFDELKLG